MSFTRAPFFTRIPSPLRYPLFLLFVVSVVFTSVSLVSALSSDTTDDGKDELFMVSIDSSSNLDWELLSSDSGFGTAVSSASDLGKSGNHLAPGEWLGDGTMRFGFIDDKPKQKTVEWTIQGDGGTTQTIEFGKPKDVLVAGADFNGDGIPDAAAVSRNGTATVRFSPFLDSASSTTLNFPRKMAQHIRGRRGEVGFITLNGTDQLLIVFKRKINNISRYRVRRGDGSNTVLTTVPRGNLVGVMPFLLSDGTHGYLLEEKISKTSRRVRIFGLDGSLLYGNSFTGSTVVVGLFTTDGATGGQFAVKNGTSLTVVTPFNGAAQEVLTISSGVLADLVNINQFKSSGGSSSGGSGGTSGGGSTGGDGSCSSFTGFTNGRLWKPEADAPDSREGKPVVLFTGGNKNGERSSLNVYASNGTKICSLGFKASSIPGVNNGADHYFSGWPGGCSKTCSQMRSLSRSAGGNGNVAVEWKGTTCLGPVDPCSRAGGI